MLVSNPACPFPNFSTLTSEELNEKRKIVRNKNVEDFIGYNLGAEHFLIVSS